MQKNGSDLSFKSNYDREAIRSHLDTMRSKFADGISRLTMMCLKEKALIDPDKIFMHRDFKIKHIEFQLGTDLYILTKGKSMRSVDRDEIYKGGYILNSSRKFMCEDFELSLNEGTLICCCKSEKESEYENIIQRNRWGYIEDSSGKKLRLFWDRDFTLDPRYSNDNV